MKKDNVVVLDKEWWKRDRAPTKRLNIQAKAQLSDRYFSVLQLASLWGVSPDVVYQLIWDRKLSAHRIGRVYRISQREVERYLGANQSQARGG